MALASTKFTATPAEPVRAGPREDPRIAQRVAVIWGLLLFNVLGTARFELLPIPRRGLQLLTMGALGVALLLALALNRRLVIRPNLVLTLYTVLACSALMTSVRGTAGAGGVFRSGRLFVFLAVLWLLTPWWGRRDLLLARCHLGAMAVVSGVVVLGLFVSPSLAMKPDATGGRLTGVLWPIPAPQVAAYAAVMAGMAAVLWLSGSMSRRWALVLGGGGVAMVVATHTRTALIALVAGLLCAGLTLFLHRHRVRRVAKTALIVVPIAAVLLAPALSGWFQRGQSGEQIKGLTGRKQVWTMLMDGPRSEFNQWFGFGLSDKSFDGLPIDSTWLAVYQDQGLFADLVVGAILLYLLLAPATCRAGPERALAMFLVVYCTVASYTEVGLGDASPYLLHIVVAASLVAGARSDVRELP